MSQWDVENMRLSGRGPNTTGFSLLNPKSIGGVNHSDILEVCVVPTLAKNARMGHPAKSADQGGSGPAARSIHESVKKLRNQSDIAVKTLANVS